MSIESRLTRLEKTRLEKMELFSSDLKKLNDEELEKLQKQLNAEHAKIVGQKKADDFSNWIATLSDEELDSLQNNSHKLRTELQKLGIDVY